MVCGLGSRDHGNMRSAAALIIIIKIIKVNTGGHTQQDINIYTNIYSVICMQI